MWKAEVYVTLKKTVLDPQGATVQNALGALGYKNVLDVRVGKFMELAIEGGDREQVAAQVEEMCRRLLANPVIEEFRFHLEEAATTGRQAP